MIEPSVDADYLIVGAGAAGMGFADVVIAESGASMVMVDGHQSPGGHWNDAYPFVRLHHPSHYYGVHSRPLGDHSIQRTGWNAGLLHMASQPEILAHYQHVMDDHLLASGRVQYWPMSHYNGDGMVTSKLTGAQRQVRAKTIVDATMSGTTVPSTHARPYTVAEGVTCIPLNDLPRLAVPPNGITVIGSGKTGMDACLWLLGQGVAPERMTWVVPRDAWWMDRAKAQFSPQFFEASVSNIADQMEALGAAATVDDLFLGLEACGAFLRLDPAVKPTMFHGATISRPELEQLQRIKTVVRLGRVLSVAPHAMVLQRGTVPAAPGQIYVDCSASGFAVRPTVPVFGDKTITLQMLKSFQPTFSAALIGHIECSYADASTKNALATPVPPPRHAHDWLKMMAASMTNQNRWGADAALMGWILNCRLDPMTSLMRNVGETETAKLAILQRSRKATRAAVGNLQTLMGSLR
jgi:hypothetical protein